MSRITNWYMEDNAVLAVSGRGEPSAECRGEGVRYAAFCLSLHYLHFIAS